MPQTTYTTDDMTNLSKFTQPSSSPKRDTNGAVYYVQSPSLHEEADKLSAFSTPLGSSPNHHHSRESSTTRLFISTLKQWAGSKSGLDRFRYSGRDLEEGEFDDDGGHSMKYYFGWFIVCFLGLFGVFALMLWGVTKCFSPQIHVQKILLLDLNIQAGMDGTGVPTEMMSLNSTVTISYKNSASFFGAHVTPSPFLFSHFDLILASGQMKKFYQSRKSHSHVTTVVSGHQIPLFGGRSFVASMRRVDNIYYTDKISVSANLTFTIRTRAYILGKLVKSKFYRHVRCPVILDANHLGQNVYRKNSCFYD